MDQYFRDIILGVTNGSDIDSGELIQNLWSNYGEIIRFRVTGGNCGSVVVKDVRLPINDFHPRGWVTDISHNRKLKSYRVESSWYKSWSKLCGDDCRIPKLLTIDYRGDEVLLVMEDLNDSGFPLRKSSVTIDEMKLCIEWLANFHGAFLGREPEELWEKGTYWHIDTRPDELEALTDKKLKDAAWKIDELLESAQFKTIVHGDAKLANFCFSEDGKSVAAVDFQYVGGGVGVKDLIYFIGSCLYEEDCEYYEEEFLNYYFNKLERKLHGSGIDFRALEKEWRALYPVAWCDFHRFLKGWSPGHWKINSYSERLTREVLESL